MAVHDLETALCPLRPHRTFKHQHGACRPSTHAQLIHKGKVVITTCARILKILLPSSDGTRLSKNLASALNAHSSLILSPIAFQKSRLSQSRGRPLTQRVFKKLKVFLLGRRNPCPLRTKAPGIFARTEGPLRGEGFP